MILRKCSLVCLLLMCFLVTCTVRTDVDTESAAVIPYPTNLVKGSSGFVIDADTKIFVIGGNEAFSVASYFASMITASSSFTLSVDEAEKAVVDNTILFELIRADSATERYELQVTSNGIHVKAGTAAGLFYAVQTIRQLLPSAIESKVKQIESWQVPAVTIVDRPKFSWRGMHLDVSRHFFSVEFVKQFIDRLALYKFNTFHLHLTDDQGWRIEIKKYPQLTEQGAWRVFNDQDSVCLKKSVENPDFALPSAFLQERGTQQMYGGFYTQEDIKEIVAYAADHFITVVPEIDMPGHMKAVLNSMPELSCVDGSGWGKIFSIPLCPCEESTYAFVENVLAEIVPLFPGKYIHIGADEVDKITWAQAKSCKDLMKRQGIKKVDELQGYFVRRVEKFLKSKGKTMIGWDEVLEGGVDSTTTIMYWRGWVQDAPVQAVRKSHDVIMSPTSHCYFDYLPDNTSLEHTYMFDPIPAQLNEVEGKRIIGLQANIWTEWIPTVARLDYMTMPRMMALAEVAWSSTKNFSDFSKRLSYHYSRLDLLGVNYRLPDIPNVKKHIVFIDNEKLVLEKPLGISEIRFTTDGSIPDSLVRLYEHPIEIDSTTIFNILTIGAKGRSGNLYTIHFEKQNYMVSISPKHLQKGLMCRYYEGVYSTVTKIASSQLKKNINIDQIKIPSFCREDEFALKFEGLIEVPADGIYTFFLSSDDGSILRIGDRMVINNDGFHGNIETNGQVALKKGLHPIDLSYFESGGGSSLMLQYEGPSTPKQDIPSSALWNTKN